MLFYIPMASRRSTTRSLTPTRNPSSYPPTRLCHICVLGNSFRRYALQDEENRSGPAAKAAHVLEAGRFASELQVVGTGEGDLDEDDWFPRVFKETSWHFFQAEDKVDLATSPPPFLQPAGRDKFQSSIR